MRWLRRLPPGHFLPRRPPPHPVASHRLLFRLQPLAPRSSPAAASPTSRRSPPGRCVPQTTTLIQRCCAALAAARTVLDHINSVIAPLPAPAFCVPSPSSGGCREEVPGLWRAHARRRQLQLHRPRLPRRRRAGSQRPDLCVLAAMRMHFQGAPLGGLSAAVPAFAAALSLHSPPRTSHRAPLLNTADTDGAAGTVDGTSCAAPMTAGFFSLLNAIRIKVRGTTSQVIYRALDEPRGPVTRACRPAPRRRHRLHASPSLHAHRCPAGRQAQAGLPQPPDLQPAGRRHD